MVRRSIILVSYASALAVAIFTISLFAGGDDGRHTHSHAIADGLPQGAAAEPTWGDIDCDGSSNSVDALKGLQFVAGLVVQQEEDCPEIESDQGAGLWGDWDCSGTVNSVDSLQVLRNLGGLQVVQTQPCPEIGEPIGIPVEVSELLDEEGWRDYGDAPDGTATGYTDSAAIGNFPADPANNGPAHAAPFPVRLGEFATAEDAPYVGSDADDGLQALDLLTCDTSAALIMMSHGTVGEGGAGGTAYLNILADWNKDGDWGDAGGCAPEWAIQNLAVDLDDADTGTLNRAFEFEGGEQVDEFWMRISLTRTPYDPAVGGELEGETEDVLISGGEIAGRTPVLAQPASPLGATNDLFFCKGRVIPHGLGLSGFTLLQPAIEQTESSRAAGFRPTSVQLGSGQPRAQDGSMQSNFQSSGTPSGTAKVLADGRARIDVVVFAVTQEDPPPRMEYYNMPFVVQGQSTTGPFRANVTCGIYIEHSGTATNDIFTPDNDGFRGGPGRAGKTPGDPEPRFIVVSHGDRIVLTSDSLAPKLEQDGSKYDPDSLTVYDENLQRLNPTALKESVGIDVTIPAMGRGIIVDTVEDDRGKLSVLPVIIRINGKNSDDDEFVDYFRIVVNHDDDMRTRDLIKKLLDDGVALKSFNQDESYAVSYIDGTSIRSKVPPFAGLVWEEEQICQVGAGRASGVEPQGGQNPFLWLFGVPDDDDFDPPGEVFGRRPAYIVDNKDLYVLNPGASGPDAHCIDDATKYTSFQSPAFSVRGSDCGDDIMLGLSSPSYSGLMKVAKDSTGAVPPVNGENHTYPHCYNIPGGGVGIITSTPGDEGRSNLGYVPYLPCGGACVSGTTPLGQDGFVILTPANPNEHFIAAAVSPDGTKIAFQYDVRDEIGQLLNSQVYVGDFDPTIPAISNALPVTSDGQNGLPSWSPDSQQIAFVSSRDGNIEVYVMNADGSEQVNLTNTPEVGESFPSWQSP